MLKIKVDGFEVYDETANRFIESPATYLKLEHSLISVSKWEAKYHKSFLPFILYMFFENNDCPRAIPAMTPMPALLSFCIIGSRSCLIIL